MSGQYLLEIKEKRKKIYPAMRQVQKDTKTRIQLVCDVLKIEEEVYT